MSEYFWNSVVGHHFVFVHENTVESDRRRSLKEQPCDQWSELNVKLNISLLAFWFIMKLVLCLLSNYLNFKLRNFSIKKKKKKEEVRIAIHGFNGGLPKPEQLKTTI